MSSVASTAHSFNKILNQPRLSSKSRQAGDVDEAIKKLRRLILVDGIPSSVVRLSYWNNVLYMFAITDLQDPTLRPRIWKILLRVNQDLSAETFLQYVSRGPCEVREKIRNDTFRYAFNWF